MATSFFLPNILGINWQSIALQSCGEILGHSITPLYCSRELFKMCSSWETLLNMLGGEVVVAGSQVGCITEIEGSNYYPSYKTGIVWCKWGPERIVVRTLCEQGQDVVDWNELSFSKGKKKTLIKAGWGLAPAGQVVTNLPGVPGTCWTRGTCIQLWAPAEKKKYNTSPLWTLLTVSPMCSTVAPGFQFTSTNRDHIYDPRCLLHWQVVMDPLGSDSQSQKLHLLPWKYNCWHQGSDSILPLNEN